MPPPPVADADRAVGRAAPLPPAERREAIITAVLPLLIQRGAAVTSRELAHAAGVAEGTIFKVFGDKDGVFAAALERVVDPGPLERAIAAIDPALEFEARLARATALMQHRLIDIWNLFSKVPPSVLPTQPRTLDDSAALVALFAAEPSRLRLDPALAARRYRALVLALSHPLLHVPPPEPDEIVDLFLHGAGVR